MGIAITTIEKSSEDSFIISSCQKKEDDKLQTLQKLLVALAEAQVEQEQLLAGKKAEKSLEKKAEIIKKNKDITIIVDDDDNRERLKDKFMDGVLSITLDMDGFEKFHLQQYQQQLANYTRFLAEYLSSEIEMVQTGGLYSYTSSGEKQKETKTEVQMLTHGERRDYVRATVMNAVLGAGTNYIAPEIKESWELWRIFQHNQIMSFLYTSEWRH